MTSGRRVLNSWKEIAAYLGRDMRTVRRWEHERGLPVRRLGGRRGPVLADADEIDRWLLPDRTPPPARENEMPSQPAGDSRLPRVGIVAAAVVVLLAVGGLAARRLLPPPEIVRLDFRDGRMMAIDAGGRDAWAASFSGTLAHPPLRNWQALSDITGDGRTDAIVAVPLRDSPGDGFAREILHAFGPAGEPYWQVNPRDELRFDETFAPPWNSGDVVVFGPPASRRVAWAVHHHTWWPSIVLLIDRNGVVTSRFVNAGWISHLAVSPDGSRLYASGVSNSRRASIVAELDGSAFAGASPEEPGAFRCRSCEGGGARHYLVFPASEVQEAGAFAPAPPIVQTWPDGRFEVHISQTGDAGGGADAVYEFSADHRLIRAAYSDSYAGWHRRLEQSGAIRHSLAACPRLIPAAPVDRR